MADTSPAAVLERAAYDDALGNRRTADMLRALVARATPEAETPAVRVKALVWYCFGKECERAESGFGLINVVWGFQDGCAFMMHGAKSQAYPSADAAKAAAQSDYEARILAALEPAPVQGWRTDMDAIPKGLAVLAALSNGWHEIITDRSEEGDYARWYVSQGRTSLPIERTHPRDTDWGNTLRVVAWMPLPPAPQEDA
ncbi:hypothetical protein [Falsirhodobacter sp. 20TX0035]|uniref:hypothetical protein n=1 Tax=Falsirhodobacter sp. 20TX0035 TaxID=3022019 RepID=UPI00232E51A8|nr:hypothetical protein [Falsirhodobacter sp. 20TX0035]MDB6454995.1 hypothetical protein [Falsirhodobacter sp. 20TX0035]